MEKIKSFLHWLSGFPVWIRAIVILLVGIIAFGFTMTSCGQTVRVTVKDTPNGVSISTTQTKKDTSGTNINISPNINFPTR